MATVQAVLYLVAVVLLVLAAVGVPARVRLDLLGWACAVLAFALPTISAGL
jgi:hypothetical protein